MRKISREDAIRVKLISLAETLYDWTETVHINWTQFYFERLQFSNHSDRNQATIMGLIYFAGPGIYLHGKSVAQEYFQGQVYLANTFQYVIHAKYFIKMYYYVLL